MVTKETLEEEMREALRSGDELKKRTLRMILTAIKLAEVERREPLDESKVMGLLQKEAKARRETIADAEKAGRDDLNAEAQAELALLETYLPQALEPEELEALVRQVINETGASEPKDLGTVMKALMPQIQGRAEGKEVSDLVRKLLTPA